MDPLNNDSNQVSPSPVSSPDTATPPTTSISSQPPRVVSVVTPTTTPPQTNPPQTNPMQMGHVEKSSKLLYGFIGLLLLILIALIGLFFYNRFSAATSAKENINNIVVATTEPQATPTVIIPTYGSQEEKDVMGVEVGDVDSQLNIIEKDTNKL
ncbi:hypothetical protein BH09PAT2_BH09PAT2_09600 [soil metagenome]